MPDFTIRKYQPRDELALQDITYETGFKGQGLSGMDFVNDRRLWFLIFIYTTLATSRSTVSSLLIQ